MGEATGLLRLHRKVPGTRNKAGRRASWNAAAIGSPRVSFASCDPRTPAVTLWCARVDSGLGGGGSGGACRPPSEGSRL